MTEIVQPEDMARMFAMEGSFKAKRAGKVQVGTTVPPGVVVGPLSATEKKSLARLETRVRNGMAGFVDAGQALAEIREKALYRQHGTFEEYCGDVWGITDRFARMQITAAATVATYGGIVPLTNETQARAVALIANAQGQDAAEQVLHAVASASGGRAVTAKLIADTAKALGFGPKGKAKASGAGTGAGAGAGAGVGAGTGVGTDGVDGDGVGVDGVDGDDVDGDGELDEWMIDADYLLAMLYDRGVGALMRDGEFVPLSDGAIHTLQQTQETLATFAALVGDALAAQGKTVAA